MPQSQIAYKSTSEKDQIELQGVIDILQDLIVDTFDGTCADKGYQGQWHNRILACAKIENVVVSNNKPSWKAVERQIAKKIETHESDDKESESSISTSSKSKTSTPLKTRLVKEDKEEIEKMLTDLDPAKFWTLKSTEVEAQENDGEAKTVEEKVKEFATKCNYWHPCQSLIVDLDDANWSAVFSENELEEIRGYGGPVLRTLPKEIDEKLNDISNLETAAQAYAYAQKLEHDPLSQPLLSWLSIAVMSTAKYFLKDNSGEIADMLESDRMYHLWGFVNTVFQGTGIRAIGMANSQARTSKRKMSAIDASENKKMGHRIDTIYMASGIELGGLEVSKDNDDTKEMEDSMLKLPIVLKGMFTSIVNPMPSILNNTHILGYIINGNTITLLDVDAPRGYITRIRRIKSQPYPTCSTDYVSRIVPLLELAIQGKLIVEGTLKKIHSTRRPLDDGTKKTVFPGCFIPRSASVPKSSSSNTSSSQIQSNKKQCT